MRAVHRYAAERGQRTFDLCMGGRCSATCGRGSRLYMISSPASSIVGIVTGQTGRRSERETWRRLPFSPCLVLRLKSRTNTRIICYCVMWSAPGLSGWPGWASPAFDSLHVVFDRGHPTHGAGGTTHVPRGMPPLSLLQLRGEGLAVQLCEARSYSARTPPSDPNCARHVLPPPTHTQQTSGRHSSQGRTWDAR